MFLKRPIAAEQGRARVVDRGGDIRACYVRNKPHGIAAAGSCTKLTAINQFARIIERLADLGQFVGIETLDGRCIERRGAQCQLTGTAMRNNMNGIDVAAPFQGRSNLFHSIFRRIENDDLGRL